MSIWAKQIVFEFNKNISSIVYWFQFHVVICDKYNDAWDHTLSKSKIYLKCKAQLWIFVYLGWAESTSTQLSFMSISGIYAELDLPSRLRSNLI